MTKLSDALRGVVDRAPVDDIHVSASTAAGRVRRHRAARVGANALAGTGAAAIIGLAVLNPMAGGSNDAFTADEAPAMAGADDRDAMEEDFAAEGLTMLAWGVCGTYPLEGEIPNQAVGSALLVDGLGEDYAGGETITGEAVLDTDLAGEFETFGVQAMVLWDGMVVGFGTSEVAEASQISLPGDASAQPFAADLVNCWDGAALPASKYELVAVQELWPLASEEPAMPEPTLAPEPTEVTGGGTDPGEPVTGGDASEGDTPDTESVEPAVEPLPVDPGSGIAAGGQMLRVVSGPVAFTIAGDPVEDPFAEYLPQPAEPAELPDGYLDPETARAEYAEHITTEAWDMTPGSSRVLLMSDSQYIENSETWWEDRYFGCAWDGGPAPSFPSESADWPLLVVTADVPESVSVSYGWVVDGNPLVTSSVTNVSEYTLPGYYQAPASTLVLVRDGRVVAEAWLQESDRNSTGVGVEALEPGQTLDTELLWREVSGCWVNERQADVEPGTYTVLTVSNVYVDAYAYGVEVLPLQETTRADDAATSSFIGEDMVEPDIAIDYYPGDYVELQVWTSLGEVTVS